MPKWLKTILVQNVIVIKILKKFGETEIIPAMLRVWQETTVEELKALLCINILMGVNSLPQYKLHWQQNNFIGKPAKTNQERN